MTWWSVLAFLGGLLIPDPWTLIRIVRYRRLNWDALIGTETFSREALVYVKRQHQKPARVVLKNGKFLVRPQRRK
jgi:hypothetical protein